MAPAHRKVGVQQVSSRDMNLLDAKTEQDKKLQDELEELRSQFTVDTQRLKEITKRFQEELEEGKP